MARRSYGSGSLTVKRDATGRELWVGKWRDNGRQIKRQIGPKRKPSGSEGLTRKEAESRLRELMSTVTADNVRGSGARLPTQYTVAQLWEAFEPDARRRGLKESTLEDYGSAVRQHLAPHFGQTPIQGIQRRDVVTLIARLEEGELRPKSIHNYVRVLSSLMAFAERREWIRASPVRDAELPALRPDDGSVVEPLRFLEVYEVADLANGAQEGAYRAADRALYLTAALTGMRQGELRGLKWQQVDFIARRVRVIEGHVRGRRTTPKSHKARSVPLAATVVDALEQLHRASEWTGEGDYVFADPFTGKALARTALMRRYRKALKAAKLDEAFRFHDLRHTFGTQMAKAGEPVTTIQAWMGHADLATTQRYMHYAPAVDEAARIEAAFAAADPRGTKSGTNLPSSGMPLAA